VYPSADAPAISFSPDNGDLVSEIIFALGSIVVGSRDRDRDARYGDDPYAGNLYGGGSGSPTLGEDIPRLVVATPEALEALLWHQGRKRVKISLIIPLSITSFIPLPALSSPETDCRRNGKDR